MQVAQIRSEFLNFYAERGHTIVPSSSLVPSLVPISLILIFNQTTTNLTIYIY